MRRLVLSGLAAVALGATGCSGGGVETGMPTDTKPQPIPSNVQTKMGPPPKKMPTAGKEGAWYVPGSPRNTSVYA